MALAGTRGSQGQVANQGLSVVPVSFEMAPGQMTAVLTVQNNNSREADVQVRTFAWSMRGGADQLTATDALIASPPLGRIAAGASQVIRLVLRRPAQGQEASYRILLDQVPPPPQPGVIGFALRLSIPVFAVPPARVTPRLHWSLQSDAGAYYLVGANDGQRHDTIRDMMLSSSNGKTIALESNVSPYILAGAARRWRIGSANFAPSGERLHLTARADFGPIDLQVAASDAGP